MRRRPLAIIGLGKVGLACGKAIAASDDLAIAAVVRRPEVQGPLHEHHQALTQGRPELIEHQRARRQHHGGVELPGTRYLTLPFCVLEPLWCRFFCAFL